MTGADLWAEFNHARRAMTPADREALASLGISPGKALFLIGRTNARVANGLYEPAEDGGFGFVTAALGYDAISPESPCPAQSVILGEMLDLVLWHPRHEQFALRLGNAEWLGGTLPQYCEPPRVAIRRTVLSWFQADCDGLVLLGDRASQYRILSGLQGGISAEDNAHRLELVNLLEQPWPAPSVTIAGPQEHRRAA